MKTNYLLPKPMKKVGWFLFIPGVVMGVLALFFDLEPDFFDFTVIGLDGQGFLGTDTRIGLTENNFFNEIAGLLVIIGAICIAFSKRAYEDEFIAKIRLESLVWATYVNYVVLIVAILFVFGMDFLWVLVFNMFTILIFFILRFNWALAKSSKLQEE